MSSPNRRFRAWMQGNGNSTSRYGRVMSAHVEGKRVGVKLDAGHSDELGDIIWLTVYGGAMGPSHTPLGSVRLGDDGKPVFVPV